MTKETPRPTDNQRTDAPKEQAKPVEQVAAAAGAPRASAPGGAMYGGMGRPNQPAGIPAELAQPASLEEKRRAKAAK